MENLVLCGEKGSIANQCPITGGQAVYVARGLYETIEPTIYDDEAICQAIGISQKTEAQDAETNGSFTIMPNPATNTIALVHNFRNYEHAEAVLYDVTGRVVQQKTLTNTSTELDVRSLITGVYWCQLIVNNQTVTAQKIVIIR